MMTLELLRNFLFIFLGVVAATATTVSSAASSPISKKMDHEIRFRFPRDSEWSELRIENGEAEFSRRDDGFFAKISTRRFCRQGAKEFLASFAAVYRRGQILDDPSVMRPGSVLVEDLTTGDKLTERFDSSSAYARFLARAGLQIGSLQRRPKINCPHPILGGE